MRWEPVAAALLGASLGPLLRARISQYGVPPAEPPRTACPHCGRTLVRSGWRGPFSWLPPHGRCPRCRSRLGPWPGSVEALTAVAFGLLALRLPAGWPLAALLWTAALGVALAFVDARVRRLPDRLTLALFAGVVGFLLGAPGVLGWALLAGSALAAGYLVLVLLGGMGFGDAKLALGLGTALGSLGLLTAVTGALFGLLLAGVVSAVLLVTRRIDRRGTLPHGPFLLLGAFAAAVLGNLRDLGLLG